MYRPEQLDAMPIPELVGLLDDERAGIRADAACALGDRLRSREIDGLDDHTQDKLASLLDDVEAMVRFEAAMALAEMHDKRATPLLLSSLRVRAVRLDAIRALGTLGDHAAVEPLRTLMHKWLLPWADKLQAAAALCALGERGGAHYLETKLRSRKRAERAAAIHFLGESRHPRARALLEPILGNREEPLRDVAARALGLLGDSAASSALLAAKSGASEELEADIDEALARLKPSASPR